MEMYKLLKTAENILAAQFFTSLEKATGTQLNYAISRAAVTHIWPQWQDNVQKNDNRKQAYYISAEFLMGRAFYNNLHALGVLTEMKGVLQSRDVDLTSLEQIEDDALGNGGLGRLAACFLDSAATCDLPVNGYGIRYKYGLFKQKFENGFQVETKDDWQQYGDPWSVRREDEKVTVAFGDSLVYAVPYDMPIIGFETKTVNTLRLWQSEPIEDFSFLDFNAQKYEKSVKEKNEADNLCMVLYPNDDKNKGKILRLKQQYFMSSASVQDCVRKFVKKHGTEFEKFPLYNAIQLNDTHPTVAIPELIRILTTDYGISFESAFSIAQATFAYTNHTIMAEALEKWSLRLFKKVLPQVYPVVVQMNHQLKRELGKKGLGKDEIATYRIIDDGMIHMARLAIYATFSTNGVARIHTDILKKDALKNWYSVYPERFQNKTNGITQRRWLGICNRQLCSYLQSLGINDFDKNLECLQDLNRFKDNSTVLSALNRVKNINKQVLSDYIYKKENVRIDPTFIFDIQIKRLHEYKRQLMNAFSILAIYYGIKDGTIKDFTPTAYIFGAKAAPGYYRAKGIIKYINEIAKLVNQDPDTKDKLFVHFVTNYNVSYAEKLIPAADISEQISTAGTEASGTSNMKFMLNGAVTLGTLDGANVEIVEKAGLENNYIFGAKVEDIEKVKDSYNPKKIYRSNPVVQKVLDTLIDGTFSDEGTGMFQELYDSILEGASWHKPDHYYILLDLPDYIEAKLRVNKDYNDREEFARKCLVNIANSGYFSSDRTIREYAWDIWKL
ncbi:MAG: glycogen/starch/alpha-glucan phosphorylase [Thermoclostridium sp.]|nr:glycogen/starch/alpha-glucan phosphorylase [Thermoclostridium sp.]